MMDRVGHEGLRRMMEHLTDAIGAGPHDTEALAARGLAYSELGGHRRAGGLNGSIIALDPANAGRLLRQSPRLLRTGGAPFGGG